MSLLNILVCGNKLLWSSSKYEPNNTVHFCYNDKSFRWYITTHQPIIRLQHNIIVNDTSYYIISGQYCELLDSFMYIESDSVFVLLDKFYVYEAEKLAYDLKNKKIRLRD